MVKWATRMYTSGTHIVTTGGHHPHYYVYADKRYEVCKQLENYLNGGPRPDWMDQLEIHPDTEEACTGPDGIDISAVGPMILPADDNGALNWIQDYSVGMKHMRKKIINDLLKKES